MVMAELFVAGEDGFAVELEAGFDAGFFAFVSPSPDIAEPEGGKDVNFRRVGAVIGDGDSPEEVLGSTLGDFLDDVEVAAFGKDTEVGEFEFGLGATAATVFIPDLDVGVFALGLFVESLGVGVGGGGIEVVVALFDVFAVVAFVAAESEKALFEDRVLAIPEGGGEAEAALAVGPTLQSILTPAVGAHACVVVGKGTPAPAAGGVVFTDGSPLALAELGTPALPIFFAVPIFGQTLLFERHARKEKHEAGKVASPSRNLFDCDQGFPASRGFWCWG